MNSTDITMIAQLILESGKDRIPRLPDMRKIKPLRRRGLLVYPDGYSLNPAAMEDAVSSWRMIAREAEKAGNLERAVELNTLADRGEAWAQRHNITPDVRRQKFGDLSFDLYHVVWEIETRWGGEQAAEVIPKKFREPLSRNGYLEPGRVASTVRVTEKGRDLLRLYGDPFLGVRTAEDRVVGRHLAGG